MEKMQVCTPANTATDHVQPSVLDLVRGRSVLALSQLSKKEEAGKKKVNKKEASKKEVSKKEASEEASKKEVSKASKKEASKKEVSKASKKEASKKEVSKKEASKKEVSKKEEVKVPPSVVCTAVTNNSITFKLCGLRCGYCSAEANCSLVGVLYSGPASAGILVCSILGVAGCTDLFIDSKDFAAVGDNAILSRENDSIALYYFGGGTPNYPSI
jgi:hypothetical protein